METGDGLRVRLVVVTAVIVALLAFTAELRQPRSYDNQASRAARLSGVVYGWAQETSDPQSRIILRREAAWLARKAFVLRCTALWRGLKQGPNPSIISSYGERELIDELIIPGAIDRHDMAATREHERLCAGTTPP